MRTNTRVVGGRWTIPVMRWLVVFVLTLSGFSAAAQSHLDICSFNIQFLGNSAKRDNAGLASILKGYDLVVVQELVAPPFPGTFPHGAPFKPDAEAAAFFKEMSKHGFEYALSPEDTGTGDKIHLNGSATEWWVVFFKPSKVELAPDLPTGFLAADRSNHPDYERVPFAFGFRSKDRRMDFVLISVHLMPDASGKKRRQQEISAISRWIALNEQKEKDFIILGDMNIENAAELQSAIPPNLVSLNKRCLPTNTLISSPKPYDHVVYRPHYTREIDESYGFRVVNLIETMEPIWRTKNPGKRYPGSPYDHNAFRASYSDHHPVAFRMRAIGDSDDD